MTKRLIYSTLILSLATLLLPCGTVLAQNKKLADEVKKITSDSQLNTPP